MDKLLLHVLIFFLSLPFSFIRWRWPRTQHTRHEMMFYIHFLFYSMYRLNDGVCQCFLFIVDEFICKCHALRCFYWQKFFFAPASDSCRRFCQPKWSMVWAGLQSSAEQRSNNAPEPCCTHGVHSIYAIRAYTQQNTSVLTYMRRMWGIRLPAADTIAKGMVGRWRSGPIAHKHQPSWMVSLRSNLTRHHGARQQKTPMPPKFLKRHRLNPMLLLSFNPRPAGVFTSTYYTGKHRHTRILIITHLSRKAIYQIFPHHIQRSPLSVRSKM